MWQQLVEFNPVYAGYQENTMRRLPIFLLAQTHQVTAD